MRRHGILIAVDSVGIDPLGHDRPESVYAESEFLFPHGRSGATIDIESGPVAGVLVETDVTAGEARGSIECALTYTSHFTGESAVRRVGLMQGLGLNHRSLEQMVDESNLFRRFENPCLANAIFPANFSFLGQAYTEDRVPTYTREQVEASLTFRGERVRLIGSDKHGFKELFTLAEVNRNIFVYAARQAEVRLRDFSDVRRGRALTSSLTHELESEFDFTCFGEPPLPHRSAAEAGAILASLSAEHPFVFYKYQVSDLISHSGRLHLARAVFRDIERCVHSVLSHIDPTETIVVVTSDHGHMEQVEYDQGHPKTFVPTWYFGDGTTTPLDDLRTPEGIFRVFARLGDVGL